MSATLAATYPLLDQEARTALRAAEPERRQYHAQGGAYLDLRGLPLGALPEIDEARIARLCRVVRGLVFAAVDGAQSGHPGGSSSKAEQVLTLLAAGRWASTRWSPSIPAATGWSGPPATARRCSMRWVALVYETLRRKGVTLTGGSAERVYPGGTGPLPQLGRAERPRGVATTRWPIPPPAPPATASPPRWALPCCTAPAACRPRLRDRGRCRDRRRHELRGAQPGLPAGRGKPGGDAGLQQLRHRRADHRSACRRLT